VDFSFSFLARRFLKKKQHEAGGKIDESWKFRAVRSPSTGRQYLISRNEETIRARDRQLRHRFSIVPLSRSPSSHTKESRNYLVRTSVTAFGTLADARLHSTLSIYSAIAWLILVRKQPISISVSPRYVPGRLRSDIANSRAGLAVPGMTRLLVKSFLMQRARVRHLHGS